MKFGLFEPIFGTIYQRAIMLFIFELFSMPVDFLKLNLLHILIVSVIERFTYSNQISKNIEKTKLNNEMKIIFIIL